MSEILKEKWALILGGSSGLGLATAQKLARHGYHLLIVHRDRRADMPSILQKFDDIRSQGVQLQAFQIDAVRSDKRREVINKLQSLLAENQKIKVLVHSIAKGNLKPITGKSAKDLELQDFQLTIHAMALSLYEWTKDLLDFNLFDRDTRIIAFTSEGNTRVWESYAAISAAKVSLESLVRSMAIELASSGLKINCLQPGVTDTKALRMIPNYQKLVENALIKNPHGRLTTPEDVANAVYLLTLEEAKWITGTIIKVDGGESLR